MDHPSENHPKLNQIFSTAICGNDILSSSLYVSGIAVIFAGVYAPLVLLIIAGVLLLYKAVYTEVVEALPVNGGAYNCLLNGTSKSVAAIAGVMTILSYVATAVISAKIAVEYVHTVIPALPIIPITILLLGAFALLVINGIKDSAKVALGIFVLHIITLVGFLGMGALFLLKGGSFFAFNLTHTTEIIAHQGGLLPAIYLAFSASLLGVSGFESSANFVEEQQHGVFRKTLRNMLVGVAIFNPLIALVVLNSMPLTAIAGAKDFLLADAAHVLGGQLFQYIVVADAFLVLSGAVLTAYVGVSGLMSRMTLDNCLPSFFAKENKKGSFGRIIIAFFLLCSSILIVTHGELLALAGVYTISFLGVMCSFAIGNLLLKETRTELKRTYHASVFVVILAFLATFFGILGNIRIDEQNLTFFEFYFIPAVLMVMMVIYKDYILKFILRFSYVIPPVDRMIRRKFRDVIAGQFVAFIRDPSRLYRLLDYINRNETGWNITLVHCQDEHGAETGEKIKQAIPQLQEAGVFPHLRVNVLYKDKPFGPEVIDEVARELDIHKNRIIIGSIHGSHAFDYDELGGVRIVL